NALTELQAGVDRASHLVEQLVTMARLEPEAALLRAAPVDLAAVVRDAIVARAAVASDKRIDLGLVRGTEVSVNGDAASLAILIGNLLDNALRYTPTGGRIDIAIDRNERSAALSVVDTGPGIPPADRERVFERFYRSADAATASGTVGSGLALS